MKIFWRVIGDRRWRVSLEGHSLTLIHKGKNNVSVWDPVNDVPIAEGLDWNSAKTIAISMLKVAVSVNKSEEGDVQTHT